MSVVDILMDEVHVLSKVEVRVRKKQRSEGSTKSKVDQRCIICIRAPSFARGDAMCIS